MAKKYAKFIFGLLLAVVIMSGFSNAQFCQVSAAQSTKSGLMTQMGITGTKGWGTPASPTSMAQIIQYVISAFLGLLGIIFLVLIIYAGFNWMTAQGDEEKVTKAKDTLTRAIIGLVIITAAYSITYFVFSSLPGRDGSDLNITTQ